MLGSGGGGTKDHRQSQVEIISMQSVSRSRASSLKTTSGSHDCVIERVIMSSMEIRPAEGALWSRWGERGKTPFLNIKRARAQRTFTRQLEKWERSSKRSGLEPYKDDSGVQEG